MTFLSGFIVGCFAGPCIFAGGILLYQLVSDALAARAAHLARKQSRSLARFFPQDRQ